MANYTKNYQLHQWTPNDDFLREDFNQDFAKLDTALGRVERSTRANGYNVYNLMLQQDYEGKYTGYKMALLFDGFTDLSQIGQKDEIFIHGKQALRLSREGQETVVDPIRDTRITSGNSSVATLTGNGYWTGIRCSVSRNANVASSTTLTVAPYVNEVVTNTQTYTITITSTTSASEIELVFDNPIPLSKGDTIYTRLTMTSGYFLYTASANSAGPACTYCFTPMAGEQAAMESTSQTLPLFQRGLGWVRHSGGTVTLALRSSEVTQAFTPLECREIENLQGVSCLETAFQLEDAILDGSGTLKLELTLGDASTEECIYDYGVVLL